MPWLKSASEFPENDKVWPISDAAYRLYDAMRHYSARKLTDGHVPTSRVSALTPRPAKKDTIAELLEARLIHRTADICASCVRLRAEKKVTDPLPKGGFIVHDYLHYNPPRWRWLAEQEAKKRAGEAGGQASAQARAQARAQAEEAERARSAQARATAAGQANLVDHVLKPVARIPSSVFGSIDPVSSAHAREAPRTARNSSQRGERVGDPVPIGVAIDRYMAKLQERVEKGGALKQSRSA